MTIKLMGIADGQSANTLTCLESGPVSMDAVGQHATELSEYTETKSPEQRWEMMRQQISQAPVVSRDDIKRSATGEAPSLMVDVELGSDGRRSLTVRSQVLVVNMTPLPINVLLQNGRSQASEEQAAGSG